MQLNPALKDFWKTKARTKVLYGGRASSKTHDAAGMAIYLAANYSLRFLCTRQFQNKITESVYTTLKSKIESAGYSKDFTITNNRIIHNVTGSEFLFYGLWRNIDEIKSLEGVDICWLEESHSLSQEQWNILEPTIRKENSEIWIIFNPRLRTDWVYKHFVINTPPNCIKQKINYTENPFLSQTMLDLIETKKQESAEEHAHIYLGEPRTEDVNSLFPYDLIERCMSRHGDNSGSTVIGLDVARYGDDTSVIVLRKGLAIEKIETRSKQSTTETASWAANIINKNHADGTIIDTIGVGAGVFDQLRMQGYFVIDGNVGFSADDKDTYMNKRAECYFRLKEAMQKGLSLPRDDELMEELACITFSYTETGKAKISPKDQIKIDLGRSPDKADALALTFFTAIHKSAMADSSLYDNYSSYAPNLL